MEMATGTGKYIFARHLLRPDALEVAARPGEHIFMRHFFCALTRLKWPPAPANKFLRITFCTLTS